MCWKSTGSSRRLLLASYRTLPDPPHSRLAYTPTPHTDTPDTCESLTQRFPKTRHSGKPRRREGSQLVLCGVVCGLSCGIGVELNSRFGRTLSLVRRQESPVRVLEEESIVGVEVCFYSFLSFYLFTFSDTQTDLSPSLSPKQISQWSRTSPESSPLS